VGDDTLSGGGFDTLNGGAGDDLYIGVFGPGVDNIQEQPGGGHDTLQTFGTVMLGANIEALILAGGVGTGNELDNVMTASAGAVRLVGAGGGDTLVGGDGNDSLDGGVGIDSLAGGKGNDVYFIDAAGDTVLENPGEGTDTVVASISYTLSSVIENLSLTAGSLVGVGNAGDNRLAGSIGDDRMLGLGGNDDIGSGSGNDTIIGGWRRYRRGADRERQLRDARPAEAATGSCCSTKAGGTSWTSRSADRLIPAITSRASTAAGEWQQYDAADRSDG
jgi:Ca2+-binding RTX toxin-like protein